MLYELELEIGPQSETRIRNFISGGPAFAAMPLFVLLGDPQPKSGVAFLTGWRKSAGNGLNSVFASSCRNHLRMLAMSSPLLILAMRPRSNLPFDFMPRRFADGAASRQML
jgi:hypothetical protein